MKMTALALTFAITGMGAQPAQPHREVTVYVRENGHISPHVRFPAMDLAHKMFATIGVRLHRPTGEPPRNAAQRHIAIEVSVDNPPQTMPRALAFAMPFEGTFIRVFYNRIRSEVAPRPVLLAHVLVHEIAHILQGSDQHAESGIMKAVWTHEDHLQMRTGALAFTPQDIELIHRGLALRAGASTFAQTPLE
jgi:hypothetical protein